MGPGDFFGEIAAITGSTADGQRRRRRADRAPRGPGRHPEGPHGRARRCEPLITSKLRERLTRTANADLIRLAGLDQRDLKDLRRRRPKAGSAPNAPIGAGGD